jgi:hypothetical protein
MCYNVPAPTHVPLSLNAPTDIQNIASECHSLIFETLKKKHIQKIKSIYFYYSSLCQMKYKQVKLKIVLFLEEKEKHRILHFILPASKSKKKLKKKNQTPFSNDTFFLSKLD